MKKNALLGRASVALERTVLDRQKVTFKPKGESLCALSAEFASGKLIGQIEAGHAFVTVDFLNLIEMNSPLAKLYWPDNSLILLERNSRSAR